MRIICWLVITSLVEVSGVYGQVKRQFNVENQDGCESIKLSLKANSGNCFIKPSQNSDILNVFSNQDTESYSHNFVKEIKNGVCEVTLTLEEITSGGLSQTISSRMFGPSDNNSGKYWKMYLTDTKPYTLELNYGMGNANVDLSGLSIQRLKIATGSADVNLGYHTLENKIDMDTLFVKADLGSVNVKNINLSRSRHLIADVGFGNMTLDFSGQPIVGNNVKGSVGAGNLVIMLPDKDVPVFVKVRDSWLCSVTMTKNLKKISENTFSNEAYARNPKNALSFDLDVSMGKIIFKDAGN
ncbi:MAG TPA: hypothetical protein VFW11_15315 [Cyclobacteriaceae bacterium]|nr:hypothetical protein [Cyclobacteriaceae bacterium]